MVDVNPHDLAGPYTPRDTTLVDAVAETRRIADQAMRNNPLVDAIVDRGLTRFRGNYGKDYAWFGEFTPLDQNLVDDFGAMLHQRGVVFWRDDPQGNQAFAMYDFDPRAGVALRQRFYMNDADGRGILFEGYDGGRAFPDQPIPLYQREGIDPSGATFTTDRVMFSGEGNMVGTRLDVAGAWGGAGTISSYWRASGGGVTINSPTVTVSGGGNHFVTMDISTIYHTSADYLNVEWHVWVSSGSGSYSPRPYKCRNYSPFTRP